MLFGRRRAPLSDDDWDEVRNTFRTLAALDAVAWTRLRAMAAEFLERKSIEPVQGLEMDPAAYASVAALACLPVLELGLDAYDGWTSVVVYPGGFMARGHEVDEAGVVHEFEEARSGESWLQGPVILSWEDVAASGHRDGFNVVVHEMAHKLDMLNGDANGFPPLPTGMDEVAWHRDLSAAFQDLDERLEAGRYTPIDDYAAQSPAEFFAVASEYFFELPGVLEGEYPEVYGHLAAFYRQDPGAPMRRRRL
jgi:Mlc titration factor MtfA (ptsG expression regulator)